MRSKLPSLMRPLIVQPLILQFAILFIAVPIIVALGVRADSGGPYTSEEITPIIARAIDRGRDGGLEVRMTPELAGLHAETPGLWFVAEDDTGRSVTFGQIPSQFSSLLGNLSNVSYGHLRGRFPPYRLSAVIRRETAPTGAITVLGHGKLNTLSIVVLMASNAAAVPIFLLLALIALIMTPWIVKRSLAGVSGISREAEQIDASQRGRRLSEEHVPREIAPLVGAVNDALGRLDEGYERQRRFIASAAHELRTPIAILRVKVDAADDPAMRRLGRDVERLGNLAEQLLDLQRMDSGGTDEEIDLSLLARRVAGDLAPLLIASERTIEVLVDHAQTIRGDAGALERVVTNLVQNAIEHGGHLVTIRVSGSAFEVEDDGPGIPPNERERVFEAFHRLRPRSTGTGLGLHLVQQVVERHAGHVSVVEAPKGGTIVRITFPGQ
jgi:two-component system sensor histidine kinase TctE